MAVNLTKNKESLSQAWKEVVDEKIKTDWALFGYDGHTFDLKVVGTGDGGLEEMVEDLSSGKIMYAFCRVIDPKTSLPKFVLINWQGEGAPGERKGKCANHITDVSNFFRGAHITMNARTEDDVDPNIIIDMVAKATGSSYSFKERESPLENHKPVGSVYKRTIPAAEINPAERDKFWEKQENEEKRRIEEERKHAAEERRKLEEERCKRELQDAQRREKMVKERTSSICQLRAAEKVAGGAVKDTESEKKKWEKQMAEDAHEQQERRNRNESCRQERNEELQALISQRTINARAIFEQNTSAGQMSTINSRYPSQASRKSPEDMHKSTATTNGEQSPPKSNGVSSTTSPPSASSPLSYGSPLSPERSPPPSPAPESTPMSYRSPAASDPLTNTYASSQTVSYQTSARQQTVVQRHSPDPEPEYWDETARVGQALKGHYGQNGPRRTESPEPQPSYDQGADLASAKLAYVDSQQNFSEDKGIVARALYDYQAADETEISFNPDDVITNIDQIDEGWWQGIAPDGMYGLFPANYVELME